MQKYNILEKEDARGKLTVAEEFFQKRVPLADMMNLMKEVKQQVPLVKRLDEKFREMEDELAKFKEMCNRKYTTNASVQSEAWEMRQMAQRDVNSMLKEQNERVENLFKDMATTQYLHDKLEKKCDREDYGDLLRKQTQLSIALAPVTKNEYTLRKLVSQVENEAEKDKGINSLEETVQKLEKKLKKDMKEINADIGEFSTKI